MISIILYGRNDNYGYNLHKRAALSLNCMAEVLESDTDEILFVDYNTPDDLPTFPEAIADTLTPLAKRRLRILRARPALHERFRDRTHLIALEPISRNIALRRASRDSQWILSTNTDIILRPRQGTSLTRVVDGLARGLYHAPRFEIPESLWESFDRTAPAQVISDIGMLARIGHLNEVVYASPVIMYDGPGDFQLVRRDDLEAIDAFDEEMILGWHVDSNLAKRLTLRFGQVSSLVDQVFCYHCDHTRQATAAHRRERVENDPRRFVDGITQAELPQQRDRWGCPEDAVEEIRLPTGGYGRYLAALRAVLPEQESETTEAFYVAQSYNAYHYRPQHVLPFVTDLLSCQPRHLALGWCGGRRDMFDLIERSWTELGFTGPLLVERAAAARLGLRAGSRLRIVELAAFLAEAQLLAFEFGLPGHVGQEMRGDVAGELSAADEEALLAVRATFLAAVAAERRRLADAPGAAPRRFLGVNCIHNDMEGMFGREIGITFTPFSSRLRHGFVVPRAAVARAAAAKPDDGLPPGLRAGRVLGRAGAIGVGELATLRTLLQALQGEAADPNLAHRVSVNAAALLAVLDALPEGDGVAPTPEVRSALAARIEELRGLKRVHRWCPEVAQVVRPAANRPLSRLADYGDWDDPAWLDHIGAFLSDPAPENGFLRGSLLWEKVHTLYSLDRCGALGPAARILVAATLPDSIIAALSERVGEVVVLNLLQEIDRIGSTDRRFWTARAPYAPDRLTVALPHMSFADLPAGSFDAVVFPHNSLFCRGRAAIPDLLAAAERALKPGGVLLFKADIATGEEPHGSCFELRHAAPSGLPALFAAETGLRPEGGFDLGLHPATLDKAWSDQGAVFGESYFVWFENGRPILSSMWALAKQGATAPVGWAALAAALAPAPVAGARTTPVMLPGEVGPAGEATPQGRIDSRPGRAGVVVTGPAALLPLGTYEARLSFEKDSLLVADGTAVSFEVLAGDVLLGSRLCHGATLAGDHVTVGFAVTAPDGMQVWTQLRVVSPGTARLRITGIAAGPAHQVSTAAAPAMPAFAAPAAAEADDRLPPCTGFGLLGTRPDGTPADRPLTTIADLGDWQDQTWLANAVDLADGDGGRVLQSSWLWERTQLSYGLGRLGCFAPGSNVAIAITMADNLVHALRRRVGRLQVIDLSGSNGNALDTVAPGSLDTLVLPHSALFAGGLVGIVDRLAAGQRALRSGGILAFNADILAGSDGDGRFLNEALLTGDALRDQLAAVGLPAADGINAAVSAETTQYLQAHRPQGEDSSAFLRRHGARATLSSQWFLRSTGAGPAEAWEALRDLLAAHAMGELLPTLAVGAAGRRAEDGAIAALPDRDGCVAHGPYIALPPGVYVAEFEVQVPGDAPRQNSLGFDVMEGEARLADRQLVLAAGESETMRMTFEVRHQPAQRLEVRLHKAAGAQVSLRSCRIRIAPASARPGRGVGSLVRGALGQLLQRPRQTA